MEFYFTIFAIVVIVVVVSASAIVEIRNYRTRRFIEKQIDEVFRKWTQREDEE